MNDTHLTRAQIITAFASIIAKCKTVDLQAKLSPDQTQSIFNKIANCENLKLTELDIMDIDLSPVPADVLVEAISRLKTVYLSLTHLTPDQAQSISHKIANCENLKLTKLDISRNDLSSVPADVLVKAISRLERVNLTGTHLTPAQINDIYALVAEKTSLTLRYVDLWVNDVSYVHEELRERAKDMINVKFKKEM